MMAAVSGCTSAAPSLYPDGGPEAANGSAASVEPSTGDPFSELATLLLNTDFLRAEVDHQDLVAARQAQAAALEREISKLHEAAGDMRIGAWIEGGLSAAGGVAHAVPELVSGETQKTFWAGLLKESAEPMKSLAKPASTEWGEAPAADANADAKRAEKEGALAASRAEEAERALNRTDSNEDRTLEALDKILDSRAQGNLAIIANV